MMVSICCNFIFPIQSVNYSKISDPKSYAHQPDESYCKNVFQNDSKMINKVVIRVFFYNVQ